MHQPALGLVRDHQAHRVTRDAARLRRHGCFELRRQFEAHPPVAASGGTSATAVMTSPHHQFLRSVATARLVAFEQVDEPGDRDLGQRPVGDVLVGERLLVHLRAEVAGIDPVDPKVGMLGGKDRGQLLERRLRRAVAAPALVGLDRRVRRDVDDATTRSQRRQRLLHERQRREDVDLVHAADDIERVVGERPVAGSGRGSSRC